MAKVYINKGNKEDGPWKGACVINDDGSIDLLGLFGTGVPDVENPDVQRQVRNAWNLGPGTMMMESTMTDTPDVVEGFDEATPEQIELARNGTYPMTGKVTIPAEAPDE